MNRWFTGLGELGRSMFVLTPGERKALCLVLALALLGLTVKAWHTRCTDSIQKSVPRSLNLK